MRTAALVSMFAGVCLSALSGTVRSQEAGSFGGVQSFGVSSTYSANSSHILIGDAEERRAWTLGAEYARLLHRGPWLRFDYEGSIMPVYEETDPTLVGTIFTLTGQTFVSPQQPVRVTYVDHGQVSTLLSGNGPGIPIYALFGRQDTYGGAVSPLGARISALPRWRVQPSLALDLGFVVSARDIPVDQADQFNFMFSFGPGLQVFTSPKASWRVEYIYRHISNAGQGFQNPGVDQGVVRVTVSLHH